MTDSTEEAARESHRGTADASSSSAPCSYSSATARVKRVRRRAPSGTSTLGDFVPRRAIFRALFVLANRRPTREQRERIHALARRFDRYGLRAPFTREEYGDLFDLAGRPSWAPSP